MRVKEIIGKNISNIYILRTTEQHGLDVAECFIELDDSLIIDIPQNPHDDLFIKMLNGDEENLFADLSDYPVYYVNKESKTIGEIAVANQKRKNKLVNRIRRLISGKETGIKEYKPYKTGYRENILKYLQNKKITDILWYENEYEKCLLLLENGYLITETLMAPHGTGMAGLNIFKSTGELQDRRGDDYLSLEEYIRQRM